MTGLRPFILRCLTLSPQNTATALMPSRSKQELGAHMNAICSVSTITHTHLLEACTLAAKAGIMSIHCYLRPFTYMHLSTASEDSYICPYICAGWHVCNCISHAQDEKARAVPPCHRSPAGTCPLA